MGGGQAFLDGKPFIRPPSVFGDMPPPFRYEAKPTNVVETRIQGPPKAKGTVPIPWVAWATSTPLPRRKEKPVKPGEMTRKMKWRSDKKNTVKSGVEKRQENLGLGIGIKNNDTNQPRKRLPRLGFRRNAVQPAQVAATDLIPQVPEYTDSLEIKRERTRKKN